MLDAGLRVGEVVKLRLYDFVAGNAMADSLRIRENVAKCGIERIVPLTKRLKAAILSFYREELENCHDSGRYAFASSASASGHLSTRQVEKFVGRVSAVALGREITPHQLRHTFADRAAAVCQPHVVQELLGHKNLSSTQVYVNANSQQCRAAIDEMQRRS